MFKQQNYNARVTIQYAFHSYLCPVTRHTWPFLQADNAQFDLMLGCLNLCHKISYMYLSVRGISWIEKVWELQTHFSAPLWGGNFASLGVHTMALQCGLLSYFQDSFFFYYYFISES